MITLIAIAVGIIGIGLTIFWMKQNAGTRKVKNTPLESNSLTDQIVYGLVNAPNPNFTNEEIERLNGCFQNNNMNEFYVVIINKVLTERVFTANDHNLIFKLTSLLADKVDENKIFFGQDNQIIPAATTIYKILHTIDIESISYNKF